MFNDIHHMDLEIRKVVKIKREKENSFGNIDSLFFVGKSFYPTLPLLVGTYDIGTSEVLLFNKYFRYFPTGLS